MRGRALPNLSRGVPTLVLRERRVVRLGLAGASGLHRAFSGVPPASEAKTWKAKRAALLQHQQQQDQQERHLQRNRQRYKQNKSFGPADPDPSGGVRSPSHKHKERTGREVRRALGK